MLEFPYKVSDLIRRQRQLRRELSGQEGLTPLKVAILGGSTTQEIAGLLDLFLLDRGVGAEIYQSEFNRYFEDAVVDPSHLIAFGPDIVYLHTSTLNIDSFPSVNATETEFEEAIRAHTERLKTVWESLWAVMPGQVIQNTYEPPSVRVLGHLDASSFGGSVHFVARLNAFLAKEARQRSRLLLHDVATLAAEFGLQHWASAERWFSYKVPTTPEAGVAQAYSLAALIAAARGRSRKCLVLDLDNTLWGGVIGDDGLDHIVLGRETARAEAYRAFQDYCLQLKQRGVVLAVCSKNDDDIARSGFSHPDSVLRLSDFACFRANWDPKPDNLRAIASELNLGLDTFVFVDDNPAERLIVSQQLPMVAVPNVGNDVSRYPAILDAARFFETVLVSVEDLQRSQHYQANTQRTVRASLFADYAAYLESLQMEAEIERFIPMYQDRIAQLVSKTNQFNLTTRRYTAAEIAAIATDAKFVTLYGRLVDVFGDNGLISVIVGRREEAALHMDLWLMSCRVIKRGMEDAMLDALVREAARQSIETIVGYYRPSAKNAMVASHYEQMGFTLARRADDGSTEWVLDLRRPYAPRNRHIRITAHV